MGKRICSIEGCGAEHLADGLCAAHRKKPPKKTRGGQLELILPIVIHGETPKQRYKRQWHQLNADRVQQSRKKWRSNAANQATNLTAQQRYSASNKGRYYGLLKRGAAKGGRRKRQLEVELSFEDWLKIVKDPCVYCGSDSLGSPSGYGVDRVDSSQGYTKANSVSCCRECNMMKSDMPAGHFLAHVQKIASFISSQSDGAA